MFVKLNKRSRALFSTVILACTGLLVPIDKAKAALIKFDWSTENGEFFPATFFGFSEGSPLSGTGFFDYNPNAPFEPSSNAFIGALTLSLSSNNKTIVFEDRRNDFSDTKGLDIRLLSSSPLAYQANFIPGIRAPELTQAVIDSLVAINFEISGSQAQAICNQPGTLPPVGCFTDFIKGRSTPLLTQTKATGEIAFSEVSGQQGCQILLNCNSISLSFSNLRGVPEPASGLGLLVFGTLSSIGLMKRKQQ